MLHLSVIEHYEVTHSHKHTPVNTEVSRQNLDREIAVENHGSILTI